MIDGRKINCIDNICTYQIWVHDIRAFHQPRPVESENAKVVIFIATMAMFRSDPVIDWNLRHHRLSGTDSVTDRLKRKQSKFVAKSVYICWKPCDRQEAPYDTVHASLSCTHRCSGCEQLSEDLRRKLDVEKNNDWLFFCACYVRINPKFSEGCQRSCALSHSEARELDRDQQRWILFIKIKRATFSGRCSFSRWLC